MSVTMGAENRRGGGTQQKTGWHKGPANMLPQPVELPAWEKMLLLWGVAPRDAFAVA